MSVRTKAWKARVKLFFTKPRFIESYNNKKRLLAGFLIAVNGFIGWNVSMNLPEIELGIKWSSEPITFEQKANAMEVKKEEPKPVEKEIKTCQDAVEVYGAKYGNQELIGRIVKAESGHYDFKAKSKISTARGCAQFIVGTWEQYGKEHWGEDFYTKNVYSPKDNVELLAWAVSTKGTSDWDASKSSWAK